MNACDFQAQVQHIKDHPHPHQKRFISHTRGGLYATFLGPYATFSVEIAYFKGMLCHTDRAPIVWHIGGGVYFLQIWGWWWSELFSKLVNFEQTPIERTQIGKYG